MTEFELLDVFGDNLRSLIHEKGYSQRDLAFEADLSEAAISNYINKQRMPSIKAIINIAYILDLDFEDLIDFGERIE